ncbi:S1 family peptidase [Shewanella xiamenensis]|uniref:Serine protease n=1 Tax=Shewanella xiamenensis TaxID=332186 RepID=A0ABT6UI38_9GAMM|nr:serine protease [Shewanella xiamenensis]MCR4535548.1 serine protease [Shewanella xiamenensis]MDI5833703.1 serine protease [Shewanella xiamenensis]
MKRTLLSMMLMALSAPTFAIQNGIAESPANFPSLVTMNCTGTIIAGNWVMTAGHCLKEDIQLVGATSENGRIVVATEIIQHSDDTDFALWRLRETPLLDKSLFLSRQFVENDYDKVYTGYGFGQTGLSLNSATFKVRGAFTGTKELSMEALTEAKIVSGDSGSPVLDANNRIVAIHYGAFSSGESETTRISYVADFILSTINAWHHPTIGSVTAGQSTTIEVQSLHANPVIDTASRTGDIEIDVANSSCMMGQVQPFDVCTYTVSSKNGYEGVLTLEDGHSVTFNKGKSEVIPPPKPDPTPDSSGGGALGFLGLLGLGLVSLRRQLTN